MDSRTLMRRSLLVTAVSAVAGVMALLACKPISVQARLGGTAAAVESVSVLATEASFGCLSLVVETEGREIRRQSPTETLTDEASETPTSTVSVALDSDLGMGYVLMEY